jgi:hypothetical protein
MADLWWYLTGNDKQGPVPRAELDRLLGLKAIGPNTLVWGEGLEQWTPLINILPTPPVLPSPPQPPPSLATEAPWSTTDDIQRSELFERVTPARRLGARFVDMCWEMFLIAFLLGFILPFLAPTFSYWLQRPEFSNLFAFLAVIPISFVLDAIVHSIFGNTPGKALFKLRVEHVASNANLGFVDYLSRNMRLFASGLALGIPILNLGTMLYQWRRLKTNLPASYDANLFVVKAARPLTIARRMAAGGVIAVLAIGIIISNAMQNQTDRALVQPQLWTNSETARQAKLPAGWIADQITNDQEQKIYVFVAPYHNTTVIFAAEVPNDQAMTMAQYVRLLTAAVSDTMVLGNPTSNGSLYVADGYMAASPSDRVHVSFIQSGRTFWRAISIASGGDADSQAYRDLRDALFSTVK